MNQTRASIAIASLDLEPKPGRVLSHGPKPRVRGSPEPMPTKMGMVPHRLRPIGLDMASVRIRTLAILGVAAALLGSAVGFALPSTSAAAPPCGGKQIPKSTGGYW